MPIRVSRSNRSSITVRLGARTAKKVVASQKAATTTLNTLQNLANVQDIDMTARANNYVMIYNSSTAKYEWIPPSEVLDRADDVDDGSIDYGGF